jgi:hypothetical protein
LPKRLLATVRTVASGDSYVARHAKQPTFARATDQAGPLGLAATAQSEDYGVCDKKHEIRDASDALVLLRHAREQRNGGNEQPEEKREVDGIEAPVTLIELGPTPNELILGHRILSMMPNA